MKIFENYHILSLILYKKLINYLKKIYKLIILNYNSKKYDFSFSWSILNILTFL